MSDASELSRLLSRIDGRGYKAYRELRGSFDFPDFTLFVDHVQADPFAAPSRLRARVPRTVAALPSELLRSPLRKLALEDYLARSVRRACGQGRHASGSGKSGVVAIDAGGQEVLERTAVRIGESWVEARVEVGLPASGRRVLGREADELLTRRLPEIVVRGLCCQSLDEADVAAFVECVENQEHVRDRLAELGLVAFVGNGSLLPRESGASDRPLRPDAVVPFSSPTSLEVSIDVPNPVGASAADGGSGDGQHVLTGMGVPEGVTLIVGGGYHGKSTLLRALERAVYPHIPGDGREHVIAARDLVKIRAEDGRAVAGVDIQGFIRELPHAPAAGPTTTHAFCSENASGSTSQAASIVEAIESGARGLLLDEDTSATNFMVRDARMQALVASEHEPITPFLDRVRELSDRHGISTVLVMGGCGDYFDVADHVIMLRDYAPIDATEEAAEIARQQVSVRRVETSEPLRFAGSRVVVPDSVRPGDGRRDAKIRARARDALLFGREDIDLRAVEQLVDASQTRAIGLALLLARERFLDGERTIAQLLDDIDDWIADHGIDALDPRARSGAHPGNLARPRRHEIAAALNRLRSLRVSHTTSAGRTA